MPTIPRITRKLSPAIAAQVEALIIGYGIRFGEDTVRDCCALFLDAVVPAEAGSSIRVHRFRPARAMELARGCIMETANKGGNLATTAAGALFVLARRGEGDAERYAIERGAELFKEVYRPALRELEKQ